MTDYQQYPSSEPRGRHARARAQQKSTRSQRQIPAVPPCTPAEGEGYYRPAQPLHQKKYEAAGRINMPKGHVSSNSSPEKNKRSSGKKAGGPWRVVSRISLAVFILAIIALLAIVGSYWLGQRLYNDIADQGFTAPNDFEAIALEDLEVDWDALLAINPDTVGWVYVPGTNINYPIVHTTNNETYLYTDFKGSGGTLATFGCIFLSAENSEDFSDENNLIYGHHMNDGSMFAAIADMHEADNFKDHRTVYVLTPQGNYRLATFSLVHCAATDPIAQTEFANDKDRTKYIQDKISRSVVSVSDIPHAEDIDQIFTFSTCDNLPSNGRYVLFSYIAETTVEGASAVTDGKGLVTGGTVKNVGDASSEAAA